MHQLPLEPRESILVDFPVFKGGNQDPLEWLEAFSRACIANKMSEERAIALVASYLRRTAQKDISGEDSTVKLTTQSKVEKTTFLSPRGNHAI
ncbi:hypothetical protein RirG_195360 [Rhizophagus irregularis DAOM 197198w]|nr:hypothetical protein RirG_195360 [Rhizophagus irregularis DAOM 197198w]